MARDYAKKQKVGSPNSTSKHQRFMPWIALIIVVGILGFYTTYHRALKDQSPVKQGKNQTAPISPQFDFYSMLPKMEVQVPSNTGIPTKNAHTTAATTGPYIIQVASFHNASAADPMKANLTLSGFDVHMVSTKNQGVTWNRLYLGPYANLSDAEKSLQRLQKSQHINGIILAQSKG